MLGLGFGAQRLAVVRVDRLAARRAQAEHAGGVRLGLRLRRRLGLGLGLRLRLRLRARLRSRLVLRLRWSVGLEGETGG